MKYLKYFKTEANWTAYKDGDDYIRPNVSYVVETKDVYYDSKKEFMLRAKYNATPDNLVAFTSASNITSLKVNGNSIKIEPIKNEISTFDVLGENISLDMETGEATFPESYLIKSPVSSWSFKAKDPNYTINDNTYVCMLMMMDGMTMGQPILLAEVMDYAFTTNDGVTLEAVDTFLAEMNMQIQSGMQIGFTLMDVDTNSGTFVFIDTEHQTNVTTGGLPTYSFDSEGLYDVEIELSDPVMRMKFAETSLISAKIGDGITSICDYAFEYCSSLTDVTIPYSVTSIGEGAFYNCSGLGSITCYAPTAPSIISNTFYNVKTFGKLSYPEGSDYSSWLENEDGLADYYWNKEQPIMTAKYNITDTSANTKLCDSINGFTDMIIDGQTVPLSTEYTFNTLGEHTVTFKLSSLTIGGNAFYNCTGLTSITIPDSVTSIGDSAFYNCSSLTGELIIPNGVTEINHSTFRCCSSLTSIVIPDSVTSIGYGAFYQCKGLTEVTIGSGVTSIGDYAFDNCSSLTGELIIPDGVTSIGDYAFSLCSSLTGELIIPDSVTSIGQFAFQGCSALTSLHIGSGVTSIGDYAFNNCSALIGELIIPDSVAEIRLGTFWGCSGLTSLHIGLGVTTIGNSAFYECSSLTGELIIPDSVTTIGNGAFRECSSLTGKLIIPDSVTSIGNYAFYNCSGLTGELIIPDGVTTIGDSTFYYCSGLTGELIIPDGVTTIGDNAFYNCLGLTSIVIPDSVTEIRQEAFAWCGSLNEITCNAITAPTIDSDIFYFIKRDGVLKVPTGSDYSSWMSTGDYYLGKYNWTIQYI